MSSYLLAGPGLYIVTQPDGTVSAVPGLPITEVGGGEDQTLAAPLFSDADSVLAAGIANTTQFVLPTLHASDDAVHAADIASTSTAQFVLPALVAANDAIDAANALRILQPSKVLDLDSVFPAENVDRQKPAKEQRLRPARFGEGDGFFGGTAELHDREMRPSLVER
jgi:hypothetical protein